MGSVDFHISGKCLGVTCLPDQSISRRTISPSGMLSPNSLYMVLVPGYDRATVGVVGSGLKNPTLTIPWSCTGISLVAMVTLLDFSC